MSGFSAQWLSLREPADHAAINPDVRARFVARFSPGDAIAIVELGAGSGSGLRALAPYLPDVQNWTLIDHDPALLAHARTGLMQWADSAGEDEGRLHLVKQGKRIAVTCVATDLARGVPDATLRSADAVTASAFFDLVSASWIVALARQLAARKLPLYATLTYDGYESWLPPHPADVALLAAFHADQHRDKGFGPAAGPNAAQALTESFAATGYLVHSGASPWRLGAHDQALIAALAAGSAAAVAPSGRLPLADIAAWRQARSHATQCVIGHIDVFACPD